MLKGCAMSFATGAGGIGAISFDVSEFGVLLVLVLIVGFALYKLVKLLWAALS